MHLRSPLTYLDHAEATLPYPALAIVAYSMLIETSGKDKALVVDDLGREWVLRDGMKKGTSVAGPPQYQGRT